MHVICILLLLHQHHLLEPLRNPPLGFVPHHYKWRVIQKICLR